MKIFHYIVLQTIIVLRIYELHVYKIFSSCFYVFYIFSYWIYKLTFLFFVTVALFRYYALFMLNPPILILIETLNDGNVCNVDRLATSIVFWIEFPGSLASVNAAETVLKIQALKWRARETIGRSRSYVRTHAPTDVCTHSRTHGTSHREPALN